MAIRRPPALDRIDIKILATLQRDGRSTVQKLAGLVGLTPRPCLERVRRLEAAGIIAGYRAVIAVERLSKPVTIFAEIALEKLGRQDRLEKRLRSIEEVVECWEVSGDLDYLARFVCSDVARYEELTTELIDDVDLGVRRITSHIALRSVCTFSGYPMSLLSPSGQRDKQS
ncbi:Lrp/AsnC family transcriptional regulator [Rhodoplanes sp. Z2-YC6860]|uniref:Lrp/AsnC family transcriptional regulator n=1 Tax=Rhodoplanes sp. Z2-YC6860 TaxID=674703 RepID=UPI00078DDD84|nr:Lrp/AsnC family transcriptional regulator [Rhodoplanes sp. Z2-YC6860]AMN42569.1 leucine-responsive regulatory protein [Rhodoplanes sp. Z2-YC6860]